MKNTKVIIVVKGVIVQHVHANDNVQYVVVDMDINEEERSIELDNAKTLSDYFDILDTDYNKSLLNSFVDSIDNRIGNEVEQAKQVLKDNGYIKHFWHENDITSKASEMGITLTDDEMISIVDSLEDIDCNIGINWETIQISINLGLLGEEDYT